MKKQAHLIVTVAVCYALGGAAAGLASAVETSGGADATQIKPYYKNPSYWQYRGRPMLLFGGSDRDNIFQWAGDGTKLTDHLDLLRTCGGNFIRCTMSSREYTAEGYRWNGKRCGQRFVYDVLGRHCDRWRDALGRFSRD